MLPALQPRAVGRLDLVGALEAEAAARNSVLPPQPGLAELTLSEAPRLAAWLASELQSGFSVAPRVVVNVRKPRHGTRPAPILGIAERVAYRAIVDRTLGGEEVLSRSRDDYLRFVRGPVDYVMHKASGPRVLGLLLGDDEVQYVVKSDLAAFYEYVDHGILGRLLVSRFRDIDLVQWVTTFLGDVEGRGYGIPQMLDPSDRLSEVYGQLIEDQLSRRGFLVWRFNDDFRIAVPSFESALDAIEALSEEARSLGLIINEQKTTSPKFSTYAMATLGLDSVDDEIPSDEEDEVEAAVADYTEMFGDPDDAAELVRRAVEGEGGWNLRDLSQDDVAALRRAIWSLVRASDSRGLSGLVPLSIYAPSLTPALSRYAEALAGESAEEVAASLDLLVHRASLGGWQRLWFNRVFRNAGLLMEAAPGDRSGRLAFAEACAQDSKHPVTRAEAVLALASAGRVPMERIADSLVMEPSALASWYVVAAAEAAATERDDRILRGIRGSDPLHAMLLDAVS